MVPTQREVTTLLLAEGDLLTAKWFQTWLCCSLWGWIWSLLSFPVLRAGAPVASGGFTQRLCVRGEEKKLIRAQA